MSLAMPRFGLRASNPSPSQLWPDTLRVMPSRTRICDATDQSRTQKGLFCWSVTAKNLIFYLSHYMTASFGFVTTASLVGISRNKRKRTSLPLIFKKKIREGELWEYWPAMKIIIHFLRLLYQSNTSNNRKVRHENIFLIVEWLCFKKMHS